MNFEKQALEPFFTRLKSIFSEMDLVYSQVAFRYGFKCKGCQDNCCFTRFHHHTFLEYFFLMEGFGTLDAGEKEGVISRAQKVADFDLRAQKGENVEKMMCPLNSEGLCMLYHYRPMICRLHGIPSELKMPSAGVTGNIQPAVSSGCDAFHDRHGRQTYHPFDRTPFYMKLAVLEKELKDTLGLNQKIKMTVAQILIHQQSPWGSVLGTFQAGM